MKIELEVSDEMGAYIQKEIEAFPKEELQGLIRQVILETLREDEVVKSLFYKRIRGSYGPNSDTIEPGVVLLESAKHIDVSPALEEIRDDMIKELKENYKEIMESVMLKILLDGLRGDSNTMMLKIQSELNHKLNDLKYKNNLK